MFYLESYTSCDELLKAAGMICLVVMTRMVNKEYEPPGEYSLCDSLRDLTLFLSSKAQ